MSERYQRTVERMQSLGESMEKTVNQLRQNPELVCNRSELVTLFRRKRKLCNVVDSCRKDIDEIKTTLTSDDKEELEYRKKECESEVTKAQNTITGLKNSVSDGERIVRECAQQIETLKIKLEIGKISNKNRTESYEKAFCVSVCSGLFATACTALGSFGFSILLLPAVLSGGTSVVCGIYAHDEGQKTPVNTADIRNRIQRQKEKKNSYESQINNAKQSIDSTRRYIDILKYEIQLCQIQIMENREMSAVMSSFENILLHWLQFLKDLIQKMNRLEGVFDGALAVKDTVAYREYIGLINGSAANKSLKFATKMCKITSMDPMEIILSFQFDN